MKCIFLTTIICCVFFTTNISAQYKNVFIPEWNEKQGTSFEKYNKNIEYIKSSEDSLLFLRPEMHDYDLRKGNAYMTLIISYRNLKVNVDTVYFYADKLYKTSLEKYCYYWDFGLRQTMVESMNIKLYVKEERPVLWEEFCARCVSFNESIRNKHLIKNEYYIALEKIEVNDQLYRKDEAVNWEKQDFLDSRNRIALDSLFERNGFPTIDALGGIESLATWMVLQHSTDCEWNRKWIKRFLDARMGGGKISGPLFATVIRFFDPESGYCKDSESFISHLKSKYPKEYAKDYKYDKF